MVGEEVIEKSSEMSWKTTPPPHETKTKTTTVQSRTLHIVTPNDHPGTRYRAVVSGTHSTRNSKSLSARFTRYRLVTVFAAPLRKTTYLQQRNRGECKYSLYSPSFATPLPHLPTQSVIPPTQKIFSEARMFILGLTTV